MPACTPSRAHAHQHTRTHGIPRAHTQRQTQTRTYPGLEEAFEVSAPGGEDAPMHGEALPQRAPSSLPALPSPRLPSAPVPLATRTPSSTPFALPCVHTSAPTPTLHTMPCPLMRAMVYTVVPYESSLPQPNALDHGVPLRELVPSSELLPSTAKHERCLHRRPGPGSRPHACRRLHAVWSETVRLYQARWEPGCKPSSAGLGGSSPARRPRG